MGFIQALPCYVRAYQLTFKQKDNMLLILLPPLGSIHWISLQKYRQIFSYTNQNNIDRYPFYSYMWQQEKKKNHFYLYLRFGFSYGQGQNALIILYDYILMCIYHVQLAWTLKVKNKLRLSLLQNYTNVRNL